ncbi:site-specific integrase [[Clostridium] innocuum]|nr:site-specific integrase [[Clostridium] innocuum]MCR0578993.1 site-specific integrase [[Clostridium] innocuum]
MAVIQSYIKKEKDKKDGTKYKEVTAWKYDTYYKGIHLKKSGFPSESKARTALRYHKNGIDEDYPDETALALRKKRERLQSELFENVLHDYFLYKELHVKNIGDIQAFFKNRITPFFKGKILHKITQQDIEEWQRWLLDQRYLQRKVYKNLNGKKILDEDKSVYKRYSNSSMKNSHTYLNEYFKFCIREKHMKSNPMDNVKRVMNKDELPDELQFWNLAEYKKFISCVDNKEYKVLFELLYWTGMRIGEALALNWNDIDFENQQIRIYKSYNEKKHTITSVKQSRSNRTILLSKNLCKGLKWLYSEYKEYDGFSKESYVFGIYAPWDDNTLRRYKNTCCKEAGVQQIKIHGFRHSHVSLLINNGYTAFEIAKRIGDTVAMVQSTYAHLFAITQRNMIDFLDRVSSE